MVYNDNYASYKFEENSELIENSIFTDETNDVFGFRLKNVMCVLEKLQAMDFFPYPQIRQDIKELTDIEKRLAVTMDCEMFKKHGHEWLECLKIEGMVIGDEPTDYEMALDFEGTRLYDEPCENITKLPDVIEHNNGIIGYYKKNLNVWLKQNKSTNKVELLAELYFNQLRAVALKLTPSPLYLQIKKELLAEKLKRRFDKIIDRHTETIQNDK
ncbi:hypothetical protein [Endozoicomonas ascidiicola]|uniref:hypothetical protein n=1 Tax=Endozoicomonas ascidiicola TaxID=1698521 RepID=UPI00082EF0C1|nr:hypothetical protein [Endozoicomonas ascidiicola]